MSLMPNFDRDLGEKRRTYQLVLDKRGQMELAVVQAYGSNRKLTVTDTFRLAVRYCHDEIMRAVPNPSEDAPDEPPALPHGFLDAYKRHGKQRLDNWLSRRLDVAQGDELAVLKEIQPWPYPQRMIALRKFWKM